MKELGHSFWLHWLHYMTCPNIWSGPSRPRWFDARANGVRAGMLGEDRVAIFLLNTICFFNYFASEACRW